MNPFAKIEFTDNFASVESLNKFVADNSNSFSAIVSGFRSWEEACMLNAVARERGLPFYCLKSSGLFAFAYADLGP